MSITLRVKRVKSHSAGSRPQDKWGRGGGGSSRTLHKGPVGPQFGLKLRWVASPPGLCPGSAIEAKIII